MLYFSTLLLTEGEKTLIFFFLISVYNLRQDTGKKIEGA